MNLFVIIVIKQIYTLFSCTSCTRRWPLEGVFTGIGYFKLRNEKAFYELLCLRYAKTHNQISPLRHTQIHMYRARRYFGNTSDSVLLWTEVYLCCESQNYLNNFWLKKCYFISFLLEWCRWNWNTSFKIEI